MDAAQPVRGASEGLLTREQHPHPLRELLREIAAIVPPFAVLGLARGPLARKRVAANLGIAAACALGAWGLIALTRDTTQWVALGLGLYAFFSWLQSLAVRDRPAFVLIYQSRAMVFGMLGFGLMSFVGYGFGFWFAPYFIRSFGESVSEVGMTLGLVTAVAGWLSVSLGGVISDWLKLYTPRARLYAPMVAALIALAAAIAFLTCSEASSAYALVFAFQLFSPFWIGSAVALANEIVLPRMRGSASAFYLLTVTFVGLALGPYTIGKLSDWFAGQGLSDAEALRRALLAVLPVFALALLSLWFSSRSVESEEAGRVERARAAGEA